jgi:hypothetical protein|tara:strand:+ start:31 stop:312 length:282 start_codon:yes stop_codon:yes gene_type:complete
MTDQSDTPAMLIRVLNTKYAAWIAEQLIKNPEADWSVAALEYNCHVENIASAFLQEHPSVISDTQHMKIMQSISEETKSTKSSTKKKKTQRRK